MIKLPHFSIIFFLACLISSVYSQKLDIPFGQIKKADLTMTLYDKDKGADAVILSDIGKAELMFVGEKFQIIMERDVQIKIVNQGGFDYANIEIPYGASDRVYVTNASTFNLVNDSIVETKIDKKGFYKEKSNRYERNLRFAFPDVKEGSIIKYRYRFTTNSIYSFVDWDLQTDIPIKYSEFTSVIPDFFSYNFLVKGKTDRLMRSNSSKSVVFADYSTDANINTWSIINVPAFRSEPYITGSKDYILKLEFELAGVTYPGENYKEITPTYESISKKLLDREDFGLAIKNASFLYKYTVDIIKGAKDDLEKLKRIHRFLANKMQWNGTKDYTTNVKLKKAFNDERGNSAEINLILIAMLKHAELTVDPVILSTRSNGVLHPTFAFIQKFNYVIADVRINGKEYLVDATEPLKSFNLLPFECLNTRGRIIHPSYSQWVDLTNNEKNISTSLVNVTIDDNGIIDGNVNRSYNGYWAFARRKTVKLESLEGYHDIIRSSYPNWDIKNIIVTNLDSVENSLDESFEISIKNGVQQTPIGMVFNPYIFISDFENPFSNEERKFPINFGCPSQNYYTISLTIPDQYEVVEKPTSLSLKLPNNAGGFLLTCEQKGNVLILQSKLTIDQIRFMSEEHKTLREFYAQLMRKQAELIVLKKRIN